MSDVPLFDLPTTSRRRPGSTASRRTGRQSFLIFLGYHPLSPVTPGRTLRLSSAAQAGRKGGPRCGNCAFVGWLGAETPWESSQMKCWFDKGKRVTRGAATTVRLWWPGCTDWERGTLPEGADLDRVVDPGAA